MNIFLRAKAATAFSAS